MKPYIRKRKRILKRLLVGVSLFLLGAAFLQIIFFLSRYYFDLEWISHPLFLVLLMTLVSIAAYKPLDWIFTRFFERYLFKKKSYAHLTLMHLAEDLRLILDLQELANLVVNTFGEILHLNTVALVVPNQLRGGFRIASAFGWKVSDYRRVQISKESTLMAWVRMNGLHVLVRNRVFRTMTWQDANHLARDFDTLRAGWIIPLFVKNELLGLIAIASDQPNREFDQADFQFFREFAQSVAKSIDIALKFSELKEANLELQDAQSKLVQTTKLTAIEQLATGVAHEIHNPLTIISGKAQILLLRKDRDHLDPHVEEVLKTIVKQTKRAADITRKLLMFSQGQAGKKEPLRLEQVLNDTIALVSYQISLEGIEVSQSIGKEMPLFHANIHEMREIFFNLLLNAVQSITPPGKIHIDLNYHPADQVVAIQISDTGRGVSQELVDKLFNPFFTTRHGALGLGLFVTKQIVHRYGGSIRAESRPEEGSLFTVRLPHMETHEAEQEVVDASLPVFPGI